VREVGNNGSDFEYVYCRMFDTMGWLCYRENRGGCKMNDENGDDSLEWLRETNKQLKAENDKLEAEIVEGDKERAKAMMDGQASAGVMMHKTQDDLDEEAAAAFLKEDE